MPRRRFEGLEEGLIEQEIRERGIKRIEQELLAVSEWLKEQGFPVTQEGRIDPSQYTAIGIKQKEINNDQKIIKGAVEGAQIFRVGEQLERLKTIILNREFQGKIFFVRTSLYDDVVNKVDNLIIGPNEVSQTKEIIKQQIFNQLSEQEKQQIIKAIDILPEGKKRRVREFLGLSS